jgi:hypothetical protein
MPSDHNDDGPLDPSFFSGRLLVEIRSWDWNLHLGVDRTLTPRKHRFQGGLSYGKPFDVSGRILAPREHRDERIRLHLMPFGPELRFTVREHEEVGRLYLPEPQAEREEFQATLLVPVDALPTMATCLDSVWKYVHIWTFDPDPHEASIRDYAFSATISEKVRPWADGE